MQYTSEQLPVINYQGNHLVIKAFAGCGKTSTLVGYAKAHADLKMLYLAYNRAIRDEGAAKFPRNVVCKTAHQLAWPEFGSRYQHKLGNLRLTDIAQFLGTRNWKLIKAAQGTLNAYLSSDARELDETHVEAGMDPDDYLTASEKLIREVVDMGRKLWEGMIDPDSRLNCVHDAYLKLFQLSNPVLPFDVILFDEAQDSNPVTAALVSSQTARKIFVGDRWQQIYRWRGAEDALEKEIAKGADLMHLTNSFRFGPMIAGAANVVLRFQGEKRSLVGLGPSDKVYTVLPPGIRKYTVLNRTVAGVLQTAIEEVQRGRVVYWVGGIESYQIQDIEDLHHLKSGDHKKIVNQRLVKQFPSYGHYEDAAQEAKDLEMTRLVKILKDYPDVPRIVAALRKNMALEEEDADVVVSTVHRSKGLEWESVIMENDFPDLFDTGERAMSAEQRADELNLLYVAVTRAKSNLVINASVEGLVLKAHAEARKARSVQNV
ncbi:MAG: 3'-5' exonuclease [Halothiobacillaceae bacterium]